jgi:hypothetical protein
MFNRKSVGALLLAVIAAVVLALTPGPAVKIVHAQFVGAAQVPGFAAAATNASAPAAIGNALAVTNPASNFLVLVQGGPLYCNGALAEIGQSTIQLAASTTYLIVGNCAQQVVYAKTGVTGPGSVVGTSSVGTPASLLFAIPGVEVPVATVVCNATACGNGGNGSITDNRPLANFPALGTPLNTIPFANLSTTNATDGSIILVTGATQPTTGSATCTSGAANVFAARVAATWRCY